MGPITCAKIVFSPMILTLPVGIFIGTFTESTTRGWVLQNVSAELSESCYATGEAVAQTEPAPVTGAKGILSPATVRRSWWTRDGYVMFDQIFCQLFSKRLDRE